MIQKYYTFPVPIGVWDRTIYLPYERNILFMTRYDNVVIDPTITFIRNFNLTDGQGKISYVYRNANGSFGRMINVLSPDGMSATYIPYSSASGSKIVLMSYPKGTLTVSSYLAVPSCIAVNLIVVKG